MPALQHSAAMRFTLRQLEYFVATCDAGSVTEAALRIPVAQSSVSAAIAQLEAALDVQLLIRHHAQGVSPTPAGRRLLERARELLRDADGFERFAAELTEELTGTLELGCLVTLAPLVAPGLCRSFMQAHPRVAVELVEGGQQELLGGLDEGRLDVALTYDLDLGAELAFAPLAELPPHAVVPADHALAGSDAVTMEQLAAEPLVLLDLPYSREYFRGLFAAAGVTPQVAQRSSQPEVIRSLVANGFGYTIVNVLPEIGVALDGRALTTVPIAPPARALTLGTASLAASRAAAAFTAHCREAIAAGAVPGLGGR
jgi:DNA-binding transcriptional LysR family regulator